MIRGAAEFCGIGGRPRQNSPAVAVAKSRILDALGLPRGAGALGNPARTVMEYMDLESLENALRLFSEEEFRWRQHQAERVRATS